MKTCTKCNEVKPVNEFHKDRTSKDGLYSNCKACKRGYARNTDIIHWMVNGARYRAKKKGLDFDIDIDFILKLNEKQEGLCAITGRVMNWDRVRSGTQRLAPPDRASLDRIDSSRGYTEDNVQLTVDIANRLKSYYSMEALLDFCFDVVNRQGGAV